MGIISSMVSRWAAGEGGPSDGWREKACSGCISETLECKMLILGRAIGWGGGCGFAVSWCNPDLTFCLVVVTLTLKILPGLCVKNFKVKEVAT